MKVKELIEVLKMENPNATIKVACDEEWNEIFKKIEIARDENGSLVFYGLSGSEQDRGY